MMISRLMRRLAALVPMLWISVAAAQETGGQILNMATIEARKAAAVMAGIAAGELAYAPFKPAMNAAFESGDAGQVLAIGAVAYPAVYLAASLATCATMGGRPDACAALFSGSVFGR